MEKDSSTNDLKSWLEWFSTRESAPKINYEAKQALFKKFDASQRKTQIKTDLLRHSENVFLYKQNFGINKINLFHHLSSIGGSFYSPQEHFGAIQGIDEGITSVVTSDMTQLLEISAVATAVPKIKDYKNISSVDEYSHLKTSKDTYFIARNFIPIPPFMIYEINESILEHDGDSKQVFIKAIKAVQEFDNRTEEFEDKIIEKAEDTCVDLLNWLFLASKGKINSTQTIACSVKEVRTHFSKL